MISYQTILVELEKHVQEAKYASNEQQFREALVATKALCDVVLQLPASGAKHMPQSESIVNSNVAETRLATDTTSLHVTDSRPVIKSQHLEEEDGANGASLFDF